MKPAIRLLILTVFLSLIPGLTAAGDFSERLGALFERATGPASSEILNADEAFRMSARAAGRDRIIVSWEIADGYYLYRDRFALVSRDNDIHIGDYSVPTGKMKTEPDGNIVEVNYNSVVIEASVERVGSEVDKFNLEVSYQGCKEGSICYPPIKEVVPVLMDAISADAMAAETDTGSRTGQKISEQDFITQRLEKGGFFLNIVAFLGFGLLLSLTPCVFPMVPILSGIIVRQGKDITTMRAFVLSLTYVLAMAATYSLLGITAGSFNLNLQAASQNAWVISLFSGVFILLALSMFGFYELQLPARWQTGLTTVSNQQRAGTVRGTAIMGCLSAIIVGPCVAPPLAGALLYISQTGDAVLGGLALFAMGLGFGVPLLIIGTSTGKLLPGAGDWMEVVKRIFGVIMLGVAIWFLERIIPAQVVLLLWAILLITAAVYMGALDRIEQGSSPWRRLWKGLGLVLLLYGAVLVVGAASGGKDVFRPLAGLNTGGGEQTGQALRFQRIKGLDDLHRVIADSSNRGQAVMLDFYADWCVSCHEMEKYTFSDPGVQAALGDVVLLQADVTLNDIEDQALLKEFNLFGPPAILFFDGSGQERKAYRLVGFIEAEKFITHLREAIAL